MGSTQDTLEGLLPRLGSFREVRVWVGVVSKYPRLTFEEFGVCIKQRIDEVGVF